MSRALNFIFAFIACIVFFVPIIIISIIVKLTSKGPAVYWSKRVGQNNKLFEMPKFRSMRVDTPQKATHLLTDANKYLTPVGIILRKTSLDELPQLWSILIGDMNFVGPRPALFNQDDLVELRTEQGVHKIKPGVTGWAQINGRDDISIPKKVSLDKEYLDKRSLFFDFKIILLTFFKVLATKNVQH